MIDWSECSPKDAKKIRIIAKRVVDLCPELDYQNTEMDLTAVHIKTPLDLDKLAGFDKFNLIHDVCGIGRHIDRETGKLGGCFLPRCAVPQKESC